MKTYESVGGVIGALAGCVITGVLIYFTDSVFSCLAGIACIALGNWIGSKIKKDK